MTQERSQLSPSSAGSAVSNHALAPRRLQVFLQEPPRDGNILVLLPDQVSDFRANRDNKKMAMIEGFRAFDQIFNR
ncbi:hypothetical protein Daus18300_000407 [Diaporthe australafricana]|uniref:Uncharacterized protein n=1 Tax=Diaporthe australafricana TaxID=127596 RepID=A0ABR3Y5Q9_9PEZI